MARIVLNKLSKHFKGVKAVDNISLEIREGEFLSLLGPSGCGKTTTLRLIAGLETPTSGEIFFDEKTVYVFEAFRIEQHGLYAFLG